MSGGSVKSKKPSQCWFKCDKCQANINQKETEHHSLYCPPSLEDFQHSFVLDGHFYGYLNVKTNEEIKGVTNHDKNNLIYLSQSAIQLLGLVIGDWALIRGISDDRRFVRIVWPTTEKSSSSILVTQRGNCTAMLRMVYIVSFFRSGIELERKRRRESMREPFRSRFRSAG